MAKRRCTDAEEKAMIVFYLCRTSPDHAKDYIKKTWNMGLDAVRGPIMGRLKATDDPLVNFYLANNQHNRFLNALHFYLAFNKKGVENSEVVGAKEQPIYFHLEKGIYQPLREGVAKKTKIEFYQIPDNPLEHLVFDMFLPNPEKIVMPAFDALALAAYNDKLKQKRFCSALEQEILRRIKAGNMSIKGIKADALKQIIGDLPEEEKYVLTQLYGIDTEHSTPLVIAKYLDVQTRKVDTLRRQAFANLTQNHAHLLDMIVSLSTENEIGDYLQQKEQRNARIEWYKKLWPEIRTRILDQLGIQGTDRALVPEQAEPREVTYARRMYSLTLSVRTRNYLLKHKMHTVGDVIERSNEIIESNIGQTSLREIISELSDLGVIFPYHTEKQPKAKVGYDAQLLDQPVDSLNLSVRSRKCLQKLDIRTLGELVGKTELDLLRMKNFGVTSLNQIKRELSAKNLKLREWQE
jgi:hypothetical protein